MTQSPSARWIWHTADNLPLSDNICSQVGPYIDPITAEILSSHQPARGHLNGETVAW